ncbi:MAG: hypothetical protein E3K32_09425 [wastewater metagenome]|nr:hypothetical protein [Candidatus Loosdrechtia aerotolerans]
MKGILLFLLVIPLAINFIFSGCAKPKKDTEAKKDRPPEMVKEESKAEDIANTLWTTIQNEDYREKWNMWPGKKAFYPGTGPTEPHGILLTTYVNDIAHDAIVNKKGQMPYGSTIIKENYTKNRRIISITVMQKREGYAPAKHNWFWAQYTPGGKVMIVEEHGRTIKSAGEIGICINCHGKQQNNDYIFTSPLRNEVPGDEEENRDEEKND